MICQNYDKSLVINSTNVILFSIKEILEPEDNSLESNVFGS